MVVAGRACGRTVAGTAVAVPRFMGCVWWSAALCRVRVGGGGLAVGGLTGMLIQADELLAPGVMIDCGGLGRGTRLVVPAGEVCRVAASCGRSDGCHAVGSVGLPTAGSGVRASVSWG